LTLRVLLLVSVAHATELPNGRYAIREDRVETCLNHS